MTKEEMIGLMNADLVEEYFHWFSYLQAATNVKGLHKLELEEFFWDESKSEMEHIREFAFRIQGLGGQPVDNVSSNVNLELWKSSKEILEHVLWMEENVVKTFAERLKLLEGILGNDCLQGGLDTSDSISLRIFYEDMMDDSRKTVDKVKMMLT